MNDMDKWTEAIKIVGYLPPNLVKFFDMDSMQLLDEKIAVRDALIAGKDIADIPDFYTVLESYPRDTVENGIKTVTVWVRPSGQSFFRYNMPVDML